ncbi:MAG: PAS domain-containing protein, partial [Planctomycetales bacterium]
MASFDESNLLRENQRLRDRNAELADEVQRLRGNVMTSPNESNSIEDNLRRRNAELEDELRRIKRQQTDLRHLYLEAPVGLGLLDRGLRFVGVNERLAVFNGHSVEEHVGAHISEIIPQIQDTIEPILRRVMETGEPELGFEVPGLSPANPTRVSDFLVSYHPVKDDGQVTGVSFVVQDVTELKQTKAALRQSEEQVRLLLNSTAEAIYGLDLNGECTFCNPACVKILGYENRKQLLGKNMHDLIHYARPDGSAYPNKECRIYDAFRRGEGARVDNEVLWRADGTSFPAEYWSYPIRRDGQVVGAVVTF